MKEPFPLCKASNRKLVLLIYVIAEILFGAQAVLYVA